KGNLQTIGGAVDGGVNEYVFPAAIFIGGQTAGNQTVSGTHITVLTELEVYNCQFNEAIAGVMSVFYWPFVSNGGSNIWRQLVNKVKLNNCTATGVVNGVIAFDGVNGGAVADVNGVMQPDASGWGLIKNVRVTMGASAPGRTWPHGTTGVIFSNSQKMLVDSCEFSEVLNQGNPDGCGFDFETNTDLVTIQNSKFLNNDGHSVLIMNGGSFGGCSNLVFQNNLFAGNIKSGTSKTEFSLSNNTDGHTNIKFRNNIVFMRKKNINNENITLYDPTRTYFTQTLNDLYYLEPTAGAISISFLGQIYTYNAQVSSVNSYYTVRDSGRQPSESPAYYLGDAASFAWDINSIGWGATLKKAGIGTTNTSAGMDWQNTVHVDDGGDGVGNNEGIRSAIYTFSAVGTYYYSLWLGNGATVGSVGSWNKSNATGTIGSATFTSSSFTVQALGNPTGLTASRTSGTNANLAWTNATDGAQNHEVIIIRKRMSGTFTEPTQGAFYDPNSNLLGVVYSGVASSWTDTSLDPNFEYQYKIYTRNNNYYSSDAWVSVGNLSVAPTSITGTNTICVGSSTTLTSVGGIDGTGANLNWYSGSPDLAFSEEWFTQSYTANNTTVNGISSGILDLTSTTADPMLVMYSLGSFAPATYRYIQIRYKVVSGTAGSAEIFYTNGRSAGATGDQRVASALISDNTWRILNIDMSTATYWSHSNITGFRFDWCNANGVNMLIDYISLGSGLAVAQGTTATVSPATTTNYYVLRNGTYNTTSAASTTVTVNATTAINSQSTATQTTHLSGTFTPITVTASGSGLSYQWYVNTTASNSGGTTLGAANNAQTNSYTPQASIAGTRFYYCVVTGTCSTATSAVSGAFVTVSSYGVSAGSSDITTLPDCPACDISVTNGATLTVNSSRTVNSITVAPGAKLTINNGITLNGTLTLQSNINGTGTLLDSYATPTKAAIVEQYVEAGRNWYISSPLNTIAYSALNKGNSVVEYNETTNLFPIVNSGTLVRGKGYIQVATAVQGTNGNVSFNGTTNSGNVTVSLSRTLNKGNGYNLVGNPYPSYLDWTLAATANTNVSPTAWFRTKKTTLAGGGYTFATVNAATPSSPEIVSNSANTTITKYIPPMQAYWVRINTNPATTNYVVTNAMRSHADNSANKLKAPKVDERPRLRLQLANGIETDETLIYMDVNAKDTIDNFDSPKMMNNSTTMPDLYSKVGNERLVINGLNITSDNLTIPLGFTLKSAANKLTIKVNELTKFAKNTKIYLVDSEKNTQTELLPETEYDFSLANAAINNENRFSLLFRSQAAPSATSIVEDLNVHVFLNAANQIVINSPEKCKYAIYNTLGQLLTNGFIISQPFIANCELRTGIYVVKLIANENELTTRLVVK
ncbi:MAG: T9SS type A sorting domain-containing protein, partial [Paludibacter sp.]